MGIFGSKTDNSGPRPSVWCPTQEVHGRNDVHVTLDDSKSTDDLHRINWHDNLHTNSGSAPDHQDIWVLGWSLK